MSEGEMWWERGYEMWWEREGVSVVGERVGERV